MNLLDSQKKDMIMQDEVTDYAKANYAYEYKENKNGWYWLRTPYAFDRSGACIVDIGDVTCYYVGSDDFDGVAPALSFCKAKA